MKKLVRIPVALALVGIVVVGLSGNARAIVFNDDATTRGLWHMDTIDNLDPESGSQDFVDDDNSFGAPDRPGGRELLLGVPGASTHPTFLPTGGPDGSGALEFDGVDDVGRAVSVWADTANRISIDFSMRPDSLPDPAGDNFMGLVGVLPAQTYLQDDGSGNGTGSLVTLAFYEDGNARYGFSQGGLALDEWHEVHVEVTDIGGANGVGVLSLTVDGVTNSFDMTDPLATSAGWASQAVIGRMVTSLARYFDGALDEVRIATAPYVYPGTPGDFDEDGDVDGNDFLVWQQGGSPNGTTSGDLTEWQNNFGVGVGATAAVAAVPEPAAALLMLLGILGGGMSRFRNRVRRAVI